MTYLDLVVAASKADIEEIAEAEERTQIRFPEVYKEFIAENNGAKFNDCIVFSTLSEGSAIYFGLERFVEVERLGKLSIEYWDDRFLAFAEAPGGDYFVFDKRTPSFVFLWDHETGEVELVARSFAEFLHAIAKNDAEVEVPDDAEVWVDPEFLNHLKENGEA